MSASKLMRGGLAQMGLGNAAIDCPQGAQINFSLRLKAVAMKAETTRRPLRPEWASALPAK